MGATSYRWHVNPDGGATFATRDGGWIYVSNDESESRQGAASAIRFKADGTIIDAYSILRGTKRVAAASSTTFLRAFLTSVRWET